MSRIPLIQLPAPRAERPNDPLEEKTFKEEVLFNSSFVKMVRDDIKLPDGGLSKRLYLTHGGACAWVRSATTAPFCSNASGVIRSSAASGNCPREK